MGEARPVERNQARNYAISHDGMEQLENESSGNHRRLDATRHFSVFARVS